MAIKKSCRYTATLISVICAALSSYAYVVEISASYSRNHTQCEELRDTIKWVRTLHVLANIPISAGTVTLFVAGCMWRSGHFCEVIKTCAKDGCVPALTNTATQLAALAVLLSWIISFSAIGIGSAVVRVCNIQTSSQIHQLLFAAIAGLLLTVGFQLCKDSNELDAKVSTDIEDTVELLEEHDQGTNTPRQLYSVVCVNCNSK